MVVILCLLLYIALSFYEVDEQLCKAEKKQDQAFVSVIETDTTRIPEQEEDDDAAFDYGF